MPPRGRSRDVSPAALARRATADDRPRFYVPAYSPRSPSNRLPHYANTHYPRRTRMSSRSPSPVPSTSSASSSSSPDLSPPTPPESLQDQIHAAYAHDDHPLAARLCLQLKTTPRDFFAAPALALEEPEARRVREHQSREARWRAARAREQRLRHKQRVWEDATACLRIDKAAREDRDRRRASSSYRALEPPLAPSSPFHYPIPTLPLSRSPRARQLATKAHPRCVPYKSVLNTLHGALFPLDDAEARMLDTLDPACHLLATVDWEPGERMRARDDSHHHHQQLDIRIRGRPASSPTPSSRSGSWLSFAAAASPPSENKWLSPPPSRSSCTCAVPVALADTPLAPTAIHPPYASSAPEKPRREESALARLVGFARGLQRAVMFSVPGAHAYAYERDVSRELGGRDASGKEKEKRESGKKGEKTTTPRELGYRARAADVRVFTAPSAPSACATDTNTFVPYALVPLLPTPSFSPSSSSHPSSPHSPNHPNSHPAYHPAYHHHPAHPHLPAYRLRPISNPVLLRLKALQNCCERWEGRAREGSLGCGRERLVGIAWERRRSGLRVEVRWGPGDV